MALVMLPCEYPWWNTVKNHLEKLLNTKNTLELVEGMRQIHEICNITLDPEDEESTDPELFVEFLNFLDNEMSGDERSVFLNTTLPNMITRAVNLKRWKPKNGLHFSLQQQPDSTELDYNFVSSLVANAFFSTFPKRTHKSHPTLQDFNFTNFFEFLDAHSQKAKLRAILHYFEWLNNNENSIGSVKITRHVMSSKTWLTIEDWLECSVPLCDLEVKHEGRLLDKSNQDSIVVCFSSTKVGGHVLSEGSNQESFSFVMCPEMLPVLLHAESLEDNEVLTVERVRHISRILGSRSKSCIEKFEAPVQITLCCLDAEDYSRMPVSQYVEENVLRELNKCLLAYRQNQTGSTTADISNNAVVPHQQQHQVQYSKKRRLTPIGESISSSNEPSSTPAQNANNNNDKNQIVINQLSCSTNKSFNCDNLQEDATVDNRLRFNKYREQEGFLNNRRGKFIILGSSGECLPVTRDVNRRLSTCSSSSDEYLSAKSSLGDFSDEELDRCPKATSHNRPSSEASSLNLESRSKNREDSTGFMLDSSSFGDDYDYERSPRKDPPGRREKFRNSTDASKKDSVRSSEEYSFSTEFSSELEEVYEQFAKWLHDPIADATESNKKRALNQRDLAVVQFAGSLLKRTLSESFAGVSVTEGFAGEPPVNNREKVSVNVRSLSLELARHKHKLAAQLLKQIVDDKVKGSSVKIVSTGNWGCGSTQKGEVQLKVVIQWLAASVAGVPLLIYYTSNHTQLAALDTVYRILRDRKWTVKDLMQATLRYASHVLIGFGSDVSLFEELIGVEKTCS